MLVEKKIMINNLINGTDLEVNNQWRRTKFARVNFFFVFLASNVLFIDTTCTVGLLSI